MNFTVEKTHIELTECLACGSNEGLREYLDLGLQPLANNILKDRDEAMDQQKFPLKVNYCIYCSHSQLSVVVNPDLLFEDYKYVSGTTETLRKHFEKKASHLIGYTYLHGDCGHSPCDLDVLDIGSNDGGLLREFKKLGCSVLGVDPAREIAEQATRDGITTLVEYWPTELPMKFDIITGCNVFAHNLDPGVFLTACRSYLKPGGIVAIEFPYGKNTIAEGQLDQVYHEHINYFNVSSMSALASRVGLSIIDIEYSPIHGGSLCFVMQKPSTLPAVHDYVVDGMMEEERKDGLYNLDTYLTFAEKIKRNMFEFTFFLSGDARKKVGYAASAKSSTVLNYIRNLRMDLDLDFIVDDNPLKQGYYSPGVGVLIKHPNDIPKDEPVMLINFAWNFKEEIKQRLRGQNNLTMTSYVPNIWIEPIL